MRIITYYIIGTLIGVALMLGFWWAFPDMLQADREHASQPQSVQPQADNRLITNASISNSRQNAITTAVKEVSPAVVGINVTAIREHRVRDPFYNDPFFRGLFPERIYREKVQNLGSGFIISPDGYVLTNEHVVHGARQVIITMTNGDRYEAQIIGFDYDSDVALLKVGGNEFPFIPFGNSDDILIGEWAIAVGNPFGLFAIHSQPSVTVGVVSAIDRDFGRNHEGRLYLDMVQTDASINRGNSGGPLVNSEGDLIGMNTMIFTETGGSIGLGFAIPSNKLKQLIDDLKIRGEVDRNFWIGLSIQNVNRLVAMSLRLPEISGVIVTEVEKGSPAEKAGLEATDVIVGMHGRKINTNRDIQQIMTNTDLRVGDIIDLDVIRDRKIEKVKLELGKKEE